MSATKAGGFVGTQTSVTVSGGGLVKTRTSRGDGGSRRFRLSKARFRSLKRHVRAADFRHLKRSYGELNCSDSFDYTLTHGGKTVEIVGCNPQLPRALSVLLEDVSALMS